MAAPPATPASKASIEELTLLTRAPPLFPAFIPVGRPNMGDKAAFMAHMEEMWESKMLANRGPKVLEFEAQLCRYLGVRNFVTMCNGTIALEIAVRALGMKGEVIVPSYTFVATAHCLQWQEITPVFCDVDPITHTLDPARVEALITPRTTGIIGVHLWGQPCATEALAELARRRGLKLMYDAAHAMGSASGGVRVGNFGDCEVFSFHATKFFNSFEGGGVATNDDALAENIRRRANFGFIGYDNVVCVGTNGKMVEPCAAMGLVNLAALPRFIEVNRENYEAYRAEVGSIPGLRLFEFREQPGTAFNYQYIVLEVDEAVTGLSRDEIVSLLTYENISARRYFFPGCHRMEPYKSYFPHAGLLLPVTDAICASVFCLPTGTSICVAQIRQVGALLRFLFANAAHIKARIAALPFAPPIEPGKLPPASTA
jgi:dTDP-4-amino-4,6-dideoxygalactose transaminase